jgi:hypothetical protein
MVSMPASLHELTPSERARLQLEDPILHAMLEDGIPITRENYVEFNLGEQPEPWTAEHEAELPEELQDWSAFDEDC